MSVRDGGQDVGRPPVTSKARAVPVSGITFSVAAPIILFGGVPEVLYLTAADVTGAALAFWWTFRQ